MQNKQKFGYMALGAGILALGIIIGTFCRAGHRGGIERGV